MPKRKVVKVVAVAADAVVAVDVNVNNKHL